MPSPMPKERRGPTTARSANQNNRANRIAINPAGQAGVRKAPYFDEVLTLLESVQTPNVYIFSGADAWQRAKRRRENHGIGTALVLPPDDSPLDLRWPPVGALIVAWPGPGNVERKIELAQAMVRDGVDVAYIENSPEWIVARAVPAK